MYMIYALLCTVVVKCRKDIHTLCLTHLDIYSSIGCQKCLFIHYSDVIMSAMASQISRISTVYSVVYSAARQGQHQTCVTGFVRGIHRLPVDSPHKRPVTRKMFPFDDVIMVLFCFALIISFRFVGLESTYITKLLQYLGVWYILYPLCNSSSCFISDRIQQWCRNRKHFVNTRNAHNIETVLHSAGGPQGSRKAHQAGNLYHASFIIYLVCIIRVIHLL